MGAGSDGVLPGGHIEPSMAQFHAGDPAAFGELVRTHTDALQQIARGFAQDRSEVEELVQDVWGQVFLRRAQYRGDGPLAHWIRTVCRNTCMLHVRKRSRRQRLLRSVTDAVGVSEYTRAAARRVPEHVECGWSRVLSPLTSRQRTVLLLRIVHGLPARVIASQLRCAVATVRSDMYRARARLRAALQPVPLATEMAGHGYGGPAQRVRESQVRNDGRSTMGRNGACRVERPVT